MCYNMSPQSHRTLQHSLIIAHNQQMLPADQNSLHQQAFTQT